MPYPVAAFVLTGLLLALPACSLFGGDEEEIAAEADAAVEPDGTRKVPVTSVARIEVGRTRDGFVITAFGAAPTVGYGVPELRPRRDGQLGIDGFLDYDFVAAPPNEGFELPAGSPRAQTIRADRQVPMVELEGAAGIRVHAISNGVQMAFGGAPEGQ
ncbi:MAG: hypothetical protein AAF882_05605 [Pseudomonadota bacterium]